MWIPCVVLVAVWTGSVMTFPQNFEGFDSFNTSDFDEDYDIILPDFSSNSPTIRSTTSASSTSPGPTTTTTPTPEMTRCLSNCPVTPEYNPVCGRNNIVYDNPGKLNCARLCGTVVSLKHYGPCTTKQR